MKNPKEAFYATAGSPSGRMSELGWNYLNRADLSAILQGIRDGRAVGGPYHAEIHPAGRCNVDCFFCSTASLRKDDQMPLTSFLGVIDELEELGTRSVRFSGGGEPLFHQNIGVILDRLHQARLRIENLTTNGVLLRAQTSEKILQGCDKITISLNTADAESYGQMMRTNPKNFERVLENVRDLVRTRTSRRPLLNLQFLVWRENYRQIPQMYRLARELEVDSVIFNGLSFLPREKRMTTSERSEMLDLYEALIAEDEYRIIASIESYEESLADDIGRITQRVTERRNEKGKLGRVLRLLTRRDFSTTEKVRHWLQMREVRKIATATKGLTEDCIVAWHSLVLKTSGEVSPCCILQHRSLGNVFESSVKEVWYGERYQQLRSELRQILVDRDQFEAGVDTIAVNMCAGKGQEVCPIRTIYRSDIGFSRELDRIAEH